jgi:hypothetical protein
MKRIVLRFGLASSALLVVMMAVTLPLSPCMSGTISYETAEILGYSSMILAFLFVFFGVRTYRDNVAAGAIGFGKAFKVGILITLITCAVYVIAWEITYFNFMPDFLDQYTAHLLEKMRTTGESETAIREKTEQLAMMAKYYDNVLFNAGITFMEVFPVGLIVTLVSAAILRRKPRQELPAGAVTA